MIEGGFKAGAVGQGGKHRTLPGVCHGYYGIPGVQGLPGSMPEVEEGQ